VAHLLRRYYQLEFRQQKILHHPKVSGGFSGLMFEIFGKKGKHATSAIGMNALPINVAVEIEMIVEVEN
jgi:enamine deaminase RidA (YjgF/YER057c/UK114 family)